MVEPSERAKALWEWLCENAEIGLTDELLEAKIEEYQAQAREEARREAIQKSIQIVVSAGYAAMTNDEIVTELYSLLQKTPPPGAGETTDTREEV